MADPRTETPDQNGDTSVRVVVDSAELEWSPSPSPTVWRKRLHRVGSAEAGQVTSVVRYDPGARFHAHDHPGGEEILVLEGVFSDEHGDWPAGTYLLNPEGFRHAPFSRDGCLLFVKLRQAPGAERRHVEIATDALAWLPGDQPGIERKELSDQPEFADATFLERWAPGAAPEARIHPRGIEIFVLEGDLSDESGSHGPGSWLRLPAGARHQPSTRRGCTLFVKYGGVSELHTSSTP